MKPAVYALLAAFCWGVAPLLERRALVLPVSPAMAVAGRCVFVFIAIGLGVLVSRSSLTTGDVTPKDLRTWLFFIAAGGILSGGLGQWLYFTALRGENAGYVVSICATYPLFTFLGALVTREERIAPLQILGALLVIAGSAILLLSRTSARS